MSDAKGRRSAHSSPITHHASPLVDEFCDALWLEDGLARTSLESYRRDLSGFAGWLREREGKALSGADQADIQRYLGYQFRKKARATSVARLLSVLKRFYRYLLRQGRVKADPTLRIEAPKLPRSLPKSLTEDDVEQLMAAPRVEHALGLRDKAMLETLYASGLRVTELVKLKLSQVSLNMGVVRVLGKGSKERLVPLGDEAIGWIQRIFNAEG